MKNLMTPKLNVFLIQPEIISDCNTVVQTLYNDVATFPAKEGGD